MCHVDIFHMTFTWAFLKSTQFRIAFNSRYKRKRTNPILRLDLHPCLQRLAFWVGFSMGQQVTLITLRTILWLYTMGWWICVRVCLGVVVGSLMASFHPNFILNGHTPGSISRGSHSGSVAAVSGRSQDLTGNYYIFL